MPFQRNFSGISFNTGKAFLILFDAFEGKLDSARKRNERTVVERRAKLKKKAVEILATT